MADRLYHSPNSSKEDPELRIHHLQGEVITLREKLLETQQEVKVLIAENRKKNDEIHTLQDVIHHKNEECDELVSAHKNLSNEIVNLKQATSFVRSTSFKEDFANLEEATHENIRLKTELSFLKEQLTGSDKKPSKSNTNILGTNDGDISPILRKGDSSIQQDKTIDATDQSLNKAMITSKLDQSVTQGGGNVSGGNASGSGVTSTNTNDYLTRRVAELETKLANHFRIEGQVMLLKEENEKLTRQLIDKTVESSMNILNKTHTGQLPGFSRLSSIEGSQEQQQLVDKHESEMLRHEIKILSKVLEEKNEEIKSLKQDVLTQHIH